MPSDGRLPGFRLAPWLGWCAILALAWFAYHPGLSGGFLFDDHVNLVALGQTGAIHDAPTFWRYITSGTADPTGRPLALLSFLLDARDWPAEPAPFLRTNLLLHLLNGSLLFVLLRALEHRLDGIAPKAGWIALLGAALWLLHPLFVSTTLYVVQREAMLPATFVLLGLIAYVHGRVLHAQGRTRRGLACMAIGLLLGTALAVLCKANGVLLPLLAGVLEATVFASAPGTPTPAPAQAGLRRLQLLLIVLPSLLVLAFLARYLPYWQDTPGMRPWTYGQRLLTEGRVLLDYLQLLVVPRSVSTGLFNENYLASRSLWQPLSTGPALLGVAGLLLLGVALRRRAPALSAALLFYFAGHLLESTLVPLELYFEHRNYLPAMLLFWPLARALAGLRYALPLRVLAALALLAILAGTTWQRATLWGQPEVLTRLWASRNPDSSRALATEAIALSTKGRPDLALARLQPLWAQRPNDLQIALNYANAACATRGLLPAESRAIGSALRHADSGSLLVRDWLERALAVAESGQCRGMDLATVEGWIRQVEANPALNRARVRERSMPALLGILALKRGDGAAAVRQFDRALAADPTPEVAAGQVALLASAGFYPEALRHLDQFERAPKRDLPVSGGMPWLHARVLERQGYWNRELAILRQKLQHEIAAQAAAGQAR